MYSNNPSTLLGSKRRSVYYPPTGTGRDTYIMIDNGGTNSKYSCQGVPELGNFMKFGPYNRNFKPTSTTKFQKYTSDGTGRDKYVVSKHGGQFFQQEEMKLKLLKFRNTMRDGGQWRKHTNYSETQTSWKTMSVAKREEQMRKTQRTISNRLSMPKRLNQKYQQKLNKIRVEYMQGSRNRKNNKQTDNQEVEV